MTLLLVMAMFGQAVYWLVIREEERDDKVWDACLYPGGEGGER